MNGIAFMSGIIFLAAVILLFAGHYFRVLRWRQFIEIYELPGRSMLMRALSVGYVVNFFIPFRIGDLVRAVLSGRKLNNGFSFALATIIVDHVLDVPVVGCIFLIMLLFNPTDKEIFYSLVFYIIILLLFLLFLVLAIVLNGKVKKIIKKVCSIFNSQIELRLMFFSWGCIVAFKDIFRNINKRKLFFYSGMMWIIYLLSYFCITEYLILSGITLKFNDFFALLFSGGSMKNSLIISAWQMSEGVSLLYILSCYIILPLGLILILSNLPEYMKNHVRQLMTSTAGVPQMLNLLPHISEQDRLQFLETYFSDYRRDYFENYLELNRDIRIIQDFSAGSNATTMLCMDEEKTFFRKYAFGKDGSKLYEQVKWIREHQSDLYLPYILREQHESKYCCYDMEYHATAVGMFNYIHSTPTNQSWAVLRQALSDLSKQLHSLNCHAGDSETLQKYIDTKVTGNIAKIESSREIHQLLDYDNLMINGRKYRNLKQLKRWLEPEFLTTIFCDDNYSDIHGDLTVENIICWENGHESPYYFIDPNRGNIHESPALDYAKLLQSLHGGYEFLMRTEHIEVKNNNINFLFTCSKSYAELFRLYREYLHEQFSYAQVRSIFFHEVVHWLRLMPYKIEKNGSRAVLFYAGMIMVFNDTIDWYGELNEKKAGNF